MANTHETWKLGDTRGPIYETINAEADGALAAGSFGMSDTQAADGGLKCKTQTGSEDPYCVALYAAEDGEQMQVLTRGFVKIRTAAIAAGDVKRACSVKDNKAVPAGTSGASRPVGYFVDLAERANNDETVIFFRGI